MLHQLTAIRKASGRPSARSLEALADRMSGAFTLSWRQGITRFADKVDRAAMQRAIRTADFRAVMETIPWPELPHALEGFAKVAAKTVLGGNGWGVREILAVAQATGQTAPLPGNLAQRLGLTTANRAVQEYVSSRTGSLIQNVTQSLQITVQRAVGDASRGYASPQDIARSIIRDGLPLNDRQTGALAKYSATIRDNLGQSKQADTLIDRYARQLRDQRAMNIGRTEASYALNYGQQQAWQTAVQENLLPPDVKREWVTESNPCDICLALNGQVVGLDEPFVGEDGEQYQAPPDPHPSCRCAQAIVQS